jgi:TRAP-type C4-dicarboxylate transport system permease small subunit
MSLAYVMRKGEHLQVDLFLKTLPPGVQRASQVIFALAVAAASAFVAYGGWILIERLGHTHTPALRMPVSLFFAPTMIGFALLAVESTAQCIALVREMVGGRATPESVVRDVG